MTKIAIIGKEVKKVMKKKMISSVFIAVMTALVLFVEPVAATTYTGAGGEGKTELDPPDTPYCDAYVFGWVMYLLDINNGDTVRVYHNLTWWDNRSSSSANAYHYINLTVTYTPNTWSEDDTVISNGGTTTGTKSIYIEVLNVRPQTSIDITWYASIDSTDPSDCFDEDDEYGNVSLV